MLALKRFVLLGLALVAGTGSPGLARPVPQENVRLLAYVGEFADGSAVVTVGEDHGRLFALRAGAARVRWIDPAANFSLVHGHPDVLRLDKARYRRFDLDAQREVQIKAGINRNITALRAAALAAQPPAEPPHKSAPDLVDLTTIDPSIHLDIRYATTNNGFGMPFYEQPMAFLQRPAAEALGRVARALARQGLGLLVHDGYRPWYVTKIFWDATPPDEHIFVADPAEGSRHNRGCAIDLTLYDLKTGKPLVLTGRYDEMSPRSAASYRGGTTRQRWLRAQLRQAMEAQGFAVYPEEWWHFDYKAWADYPIGNATFAQLIAAPAR